MNRTVLLAFVIASALALVPAASAETNVRVGTRISLLAGGFQVFPAGEPFHIAHGWARRQTDPSNLGPAPRANGRYGFSLAVDGQEQPEDYVEHGDVSDLFHRTWVHNFPNGMTGTHTFTGHWFGPCTALVENGFAPGPCEHPTEPTTSVGLLTITVVFVP